MNKIIIIGAALVFVLGLFSLVGHTGEPGVEERPQKVDLRSAPIPESPPTAETVVVPQDIRVFANPANVDVNQPVNVNIKPDVRVSSQPLTIVTQPDVKVYGGEVVTPYSYQEAEPYIETPQVYHVAEEKENTWDRLKYGLKETVTFWSPWVNPNDPYENPVALTDAEGFIETTDQVVRNFVVKASFNSASKLVDGIVNTATCMLPDAK